MAIADVTKGLDHIGIPTTDMDKTKKFYTDLGFKLAFETVNGGLPVCFLEKDGLMIETYVVEGKSAMVNGAVDHFAISCTDIEKCFAEAKKLPYPMLKDESTFLPFWEHGVKFFHLIGPNGEAVEFLEVLKG